MKYFYLIALFILSSLQVLPQQKNVLFILVDDLKPTIAAYGDKYAKTPNMDRLASKGFVFLNAYTQQAVCAPSRASMLTGWRPDKTKVRDLKTLIRDKNPNVITMPQYFKSKGYISYGTGKVYDPRSVNKKYDPVSWSVPYVFPYHLPHSYPNEPILGMYQSDKHLMEYKMYEAMADSKGLTGGKKNNFIRKNFKPSTESADVPDDAYYDGWIANDALNKLEEFSKEDKPFMLMVGFKKPHLPFVAPKKYWDMYDATKIPMAKYQKHSKGGPAIAYHNNGELRSYTDIPAAFDENGLLNKEKQRELIHGYYAATTYIDTQIGKLLDKLKELGLDKNTIIVLWGDHGWHLGDHGLWCKHTNFEQATRLPLIIYDPTKEAGKSTIPVETLDIYPTLCELTGIGIDPNLQLQGFSLVPMLDGKEPEKNYAISQWPKQQINGMGYTVRTERYRYTEWYKNYESTQPRDPKNIVGTELYDYQEDPLETKDLVKNKNYAAVLAEHQKLLHDFLDAQVGTASPEVDFMAAQVPGQPTGTPVRQLVEKNFKPGNVYIGSTVAYWYLGNPEAKLLAQQFSYSTPENAGKQSAVHPEPGVWNWQKIDAVVRYAKKNNIVLRLHGPISPQASKWAMTDTRSPAELLSVMTDFMKAQCKRYNGNEAVKWMDVVNETVTRQGEWFGPKPGVDSWENPWLKIGLNQDGIPIYIVKAFEIANELAPDIKLVYNQHGGMEPEMWERVKSTVLYLKKKGLRVDGLGWQGHLRSDTPLAFSRQELDYLADLIDWTHQHGMEFHVTELDYRIMDGNFTKIAAEEQAAAYANILKVLLSKRNNGVVTYNTWGLVDGHEGDHYHNLYRFIFDSELRAKPAFYAIQKTVANPDDLKLNFGFPKKANVDDGINLLSNGGFEKGLNPWTSYGSVEVVKDGNQLAGNACIKLAADKSEITQKVKLLPNTDYMLSGWVKTQNNEPVTIKAVFEGGQEPAALAISPNEYQLVTLEFTTPDNPNVTIAFTKWDSGNSPAYGDNFYLTKMGTGAAAIPDAVVVTTTSVVSEKSIADDGNNLMVNGGFENGMPPWKKFGKAEVASDGNQHSGKKCVTFTADKSGVKQVIKLKPNTDYVVSVYGKSENGEKLVLKVTIGSEKEPMKATIKSDTYEEAQIQFNTGDAKEVSIAVTKWNAGNGQAWVDDFYLEEAK